jgi:hypothetical protein
MRPWRESKEHRAEDMICLCANCHQRADLENWGEKTLREYKQNPWLLRQYKKGDWIVGPKAEVELTISMELSDFDEKNQRWLRHAIASFLDISPYAVHIATAEKSDSIRITLELSAENAERLVNAYERDDAELFKYLAPLALVGVRVKVVEAPALDLRKRGWYGRTAGVRLERMVNLVYPDLVKTGPNDMWSREVEGLVNRHFASFGGGAESFFRENYVVDFEDHSDELTILPHVRGIFSEEHSQCIEEILAWVQKTPRAAHRPVTQHLDDMHPESQLLTGDRSTGRLLCGRKGSGKTSMIMYNMIDLEKNHDRLCLYIALDVTALPQTSAAQYMMASLVNQLDDLTIKITQEKGIDPEEVVLRRFEKLWLINAALPTQTGDNKRDLREKLLLRLHDSKYHGEVFENYVSWSISYLERILNKRLIIVLDDIDHLSSDEEALEICRSAAALYRKLKRPMIISLREETLPKLQDKTLPVIAFPKMHVIPPSFRKALTVRLENFKNELEDRYPTGCGKYTREGIYLFVEHIIRSICRPSIYARLITFHYDMDLLLDIARCLLSSPYMTPAEVINMAKRNKGIGWNLVLTSLQNYIYYNHYEQNSFFLNMYDNGQVGIAESDDMAPVGRYDNTLVRISLLRVLAHHLSKMSAQARAERIVEIALIEEQMTNRLGYSTEQLWLALKAFARHRLIRTGQRQNDFDTGGTRRISISTAVLYYLDYLISDYQYVQNILPVTPIDFKFEPQVCVTDAQNRNMQVLDDLIMRFADFVRRCEESNEKRVEDQDFYRSLMPNELPLSQRVVDSVNKRTTIG